MYVNALMGAKAVAAILAEGFSTGWPNAPHRVLRPFIEAAEAFEGEIVGEVKGRYVAATHPVRRLQPMTAKKLTTGVVEAMPHWAAESVDAVEKLQTAAEIVRELVNDCQRFLAKRCVPSETGGQISSQEQERFSPAATPDTVAGTSGAGRPGYRPWWRMRQKGRVRPGAQGDRWPGAWPCAAH